MAFLSRLSTRALLAAKSFAPRTAAPLANHHCTSWMKSLDTFPRRHVGPSEKETAVMLKTLGIDSLKTVIDKTVPEGIRLTQANLLADPLTESEVLAKLEHIASKNVVARSYIGLGYYNTHTPQPIVRNILENPGWYTSYTPYQAEISQGRMESLFNYQTMIVELTGLEVSNASLLDEPTAAAEAMAMSFSHHNRKRTKFFIDNRCFPQTVNVVSARAKLLDVEVVVDTIDKFDPSRDDFCGVLIQYPDQYGVLRTFGETIALAQKHHTIITCATDLLALTMVKPPGEWGCDIAVGNSQRFGVPLGYGGPHAAFIATTKKFLRRMPGRLIGESKDAAGNPAYRLTLQTRETHIRREKATSNICTAQALLANMAAMYAVYHGPEGLKQIASRVHRFTSALAVGLRLEGHDIVSNLFFDTLTVAVNPKMLVEEIFDRGEKKGINFRFIDHVHVGVSLDETVTEEDLKDIIACFSADGVLSETNYRQVVEANDSSHLAPFLRSSSFLTHPVFNSYHCESSFTRYVKRLENKDVSLVHAMIALGSCTMKLNAATEMRALSDRRFAALHPYAPDEQAAGYTQMLKELRDDLIAITGYDEISLQPNSGAQGEYAGLAAIRAYHIANGQPQRKVCLLPVSAHGTNPASAAMAGMHVVNVKVTPRGDIDMQDLEMRCKEHATDLAAIMVTYPSTYGVFDERIRDICDMIHKHGGQVYLDGANMNAQAMLCRPGDYGSDVSHLNLHKTFCIPHGGGGPGMGPIGVKRHLAPFLAPHPLYEIPEGNFGPVSGANTGSALILPISWSYIKMMGHKGLADASSYAILNANYLAKRLEKHYDILYKGKHGLAAHEFIVNLGAFKQSAGVEAVDVAKRLHDFGFHSPTMSWPVPNSLMIEPTESESLTELDRFADAMICIREEIEEIAQGKYPRDNNVLKNSPHSMLTTTSNTWDRPYTREKAAFALPWLKHRKVWPTVSRVDDVYGDKNLKLVRSPSDAFHE